MIRWNAGRRGIPILKRLIPSLNRRWAQIFWPNGARLVEFRGAWWLLSWRNRVDREIAFYGDYEHAQLDRFLARLREDDVDLVLDVGANFGLYAVLAAVHGAAPRIVAFEPDARNRDQFMAQRWLNPLARRIEIDSRAVSAQSGTIEFQSYPEDSTGQSRVASGGRPVESIALDDLFALEDRNIVLKIDVEGHERDVLAGAQRLLSNNRCWIQVETWPANRPGIVAFLSGLGYRLIDSTDDDCTFAR